ncbi:MAG: hypothetical protein GY938_29415 [Ketobacter sp.]|nr:hypothetical protein [Ketobacter sp.]
MANLKYDEIASLRNIIDGDADANNFGNGLITFRWHPPSGNWWIPSRSYFRIDVELSKPDSDVSLEREDNIAPNMGLAACLFSKLQYLISDRVISEISEFVPQVDAIKKRLKFTGQWLKTTGDSYELWESSFLQRQNKIIPTGLDFNALKMNFGPRADAGVGAAGLGRVPDWIDLVTPNQVEFTSVGGPDALGRIIFTANGGQAIPDLTQIYQIGQRIYVNAGGELSLNIKGFVGTDTLLVATATLADVGAANVVAQFRVPVSDIDRTSSASSKAQLFTLIWRPPLSIFDIPYGIPGSAQHELRFTPFGNQVYQQNAIESILATKLNTTDGANNDFRFAVRDLKFYAARCEGPIVQMDQFFIDLSECRLQSSQITSANRTQYSLNVSPSTHALTVAFQDSAVDTDTRYSQTKFRIREGGTDEKTEGHSHQELNLSNFYIRYAGLQKPQPDYRPRLAETGDGSSADAKNIDHFVEIQARNALYNGAYFDSSMETLKEWKERGIFLHWPWPKTGTDRETRVYVSTEFRELVDAAGAQITPRLLLFNHFKKVCILRYKEGNLNEVLVNEV